MLNICKCSCTRSGDLDQINSILVKACVIVLFVASITPSAQAQQSTMPPSVGQISTAPGSSSGAGTMSIPMSNSMAGPMPAAMPAAMPASSQSSTTNSLNPAARLTPTNTTGNTVSSVRTGTLSSGYSAGGSTVNSNINSTQTSIRGAGQPVGGGSQTTQPYGARTRSKF